MLIRNARHPLAGAASVLFAVLFTSASYAEEDDRIEEVVVTGSFIKGTPIDSESPPFWRETSSRAKVHQASLRSCADLAQVPVLTANLTNFNLTPLRVLLISIFVVLDLSAPSPTEWS